MIDYIKNAERSSPSFTTNKDAPFERLGRFLFGQMGHSCVIPHKKPNE